MATHTLSQLAGDASPGTSVMRESGADRIVYRDVSIAINVQKSKRRVFGYADLFAKNEFKGRIAIGSAGSRPWEVRQKLRCLAKAKVDVWATVASAARL